MLPSECGDHRVLFYDSDDQLVAEVASHLRVALRRDGSAIAVATAAHRQALVQALGTDGVEASISGQLVLLDAEQTLHELLVDEELDAATFEAVIGRVISSLPGPVHIYGEMVAVLWSAGRVPDALALESLWNDLGEQSAFGLLCGYPSASSDSDTFANELATVCQLHSQVAGNRFEAPVPGVSHGLELPAAKSSVQRARVFVRDLLEQISDVDLDVAELIVSELVTNAYQHGSGDIVLHIRVETDLVFISVGDDDRTEPILRGIDTDSAGGRGVFIVDCLALRWGITRRATGVGKSVWAEIGRGPVSGPLVNR
jgi:hypothetical protein